MSDAANTSPDKQEIRLRMKNMRSALLTPQDTIAGEMILRRILNLPEFRKLIPDAAVVGLYSPIRMEVNLLAHAGLLRDKGILVALPRIYGDTLAFSRLNSGTNLKPGVFGIMEPLPDEETVAFQDLYAVCLPGLAFDRKGARLGYGKGYYDRFLTQQGDGRRPILIGVGYDFQLLDTVPQEPHDQRLDYIVTPSDTIAVHGN